MTDQTAAKSNRLRLIIEHSGLSQKDFAQKMGWRGPYISNIINGYKDLSGSFLEDFAITYGDIYNVLWLLTGKGDMLLENETIPKVSEPAAAYGNSIEERIIQIETDIKLLKSITAK